MHDYGTPHIMNNICSDGFMAVKKKKTEKKGDKFVGLLKRKKEEILFY